MSEESSKKDTDKTLWTDLLNIGVEVGKNLVISPVEKAKPVTNIIIDKSTTILAEYNPLKKEDTNPQENVEQEKISIWDRVKDGVKSKIPSIDDLVKIKEITIEVSIKLLENVLKNLTPVELDFRDSVNKKAIVISESEINRYIREQLKGTKEIENLVVKIFDSELVEISFEAKRFFTKAKIHQKMSIREFKINKDVGIVKIKMLGDVHVEGQNLISKITLTLVSSILNKIFKASLFNILEENKIFIDKNNLITIDLKETFLKDFYEIKVLDSIGVNKNTSMSDYILKILKSPNLSGIALQAITLAGTKILENKRLIDFFEVSNLKTEHGKVIIGFGVNIPKIF